MSSSAGPAGSVPTPPPRVRQRLFNYVVMVALRQCRRDPTATTIVKPHLRYRFPPMSEAASTSGDNARARRQQCVIEEDRKLYKSVKKFCFPDLPPDLPLSTFMSSHATSYGTHEETFSFTLTESDGSKRWGYCLRWPGPVQAPFPQCICIISSLPCFSIFSSILRELTALQKVDPAFEACTVFLGAIYNEPLPSPGGTLRVALPRSLFSTLSPPSYQQQPQVKQIAGDKVEYTFTRPDDSESLLDHVDFEPLLHFLEPVNIVSIMASLLVERRMIFIATNLHTLSSCVQAASSILYPFFWQHIFIPVVPQSLLSFCCAPMPFLVGVLRVHLPELKKLSDSMEEVVVVDVDNNKVIFSENMDDIELVPMSLLEPLMQNLQRISKEVRGAESSSILGSIMSKMKQRERKPLSKALIKDLQNIFIGFMVDLLANYKDFMRKSPPSPPASTATPSGTSPQSFNSKYFDCQGFLESRPLNMRPLLELLTESQMFVIFIEERYKRFGNSDKFEQRLSVRMSQMLTPNSKEAEDLRAALLRGALNEPQQTAGPPASKLKTRTRFTMYDTGAITRDEVTASLWEEEKRKAEEEKRILEGERKRNKGSTASPGGSGIGGVSGDGIWARLFSSLGNDSSAGNEFQISQPKNFRKIDVDFATKEETPKKAVSDESSTDTAGGSGTTRGRIAPLTSSIARIGDLAAPEAATGSLTARPAISVGGEARSPHPNAGPDKTKLVQGTGKGIVGAGNWQKQSAADYAQTLRPKATSSLATRPSPELMGNHAASGSREQSDDDLEAEAAELSGDAASSNAPSRIICQGKLTKLAGQQFYLQLSDKWQNRWFVLTETELSYYRPKDKRRALGVIPLKRISEVSFYHAYPPLKKNNLLEIKTKNEPSAENHPGTGSIPRTYFVEALSKEDGLRWIQALQSVHVDTHVAKSP